MESFCPITPDIFRLTVPFVDVYTSVFLIRTPDGAILFDTATTETDVREIISPALTEQGITADTPLTVVLSHEHSDHAGGLPHLLKLYPRAMLATRSEQICRTFSARHPIFLEDGAALGGVIRVIAIPGHSPDALALLDLRSKTMLSGDSLQQAGLYGDGLWGANITQPTEHRAALHKLRTMEIDTLIASHAYHPCGWRADGTAAVHAMIDSCEEALDRITSFLRENPSLTDAEAAETYNRTTGLPPIGAAVCSALR